MNRETVIALAREAGLYPHVEWGGMFYVTSGFLENFAALVAAHERGQCAKMCDFYADKIGTGNITGKALIATAFEIRNRK